MRAYPLTWRLLDVLETGLEKVFPRRLAGITPYLMLAPAVLLVGLLVLGLFQVADGSLRTLDTTTFLMSESYSLDNFRRALSEPLFRNVAVKSFAGSLIVTAMTLVLALPYAYVMVRTKSAALRKILLIALFLPFFIGQVVRAYGWLIILGNQGLVNEALSFLGIGPFRLIYNYPAVLFGLIQYMLPFAVLMLAPAVTAIPEETEAAAESLGANWIQTFIHVVLPMARPGFVGAGLVVMTLSLTDFAIPAILGGGSQDFIANAIYDQFFRTSDQGLGATLALLLVAAGSTLVAIVFALVGTGTLQMGRAKQ
ncbi:ABC transporter permease [Phyllobacterium endophyticum]|uniref:ABC transporter permease n=1 Tax=Phyllobacterium endophyticum TaxID=1149773 RepID=A0A2P7AQN0_9HYPH|nr:ABC transporter permease [Phyllobacterium endophyticum]MBB3236970.1 putative spermidine/putrescine transport system permease protein [Phyllobacterium endophyticum]PSH56546.1 ABC transporter permease [Phyllobacterium endophyticum]TYR44454.1 ABC transporter permease [Phyllobacterium endophyticum]